MKRVPLQETDDRRNVIPICPLFQLFPPSLDNIQAIDEVVASKCRRLIVFDGSIMPVASARDMPRRVSRQ